MAVSGASTQRNVRESKEVAETEDDARDADGEERKWTFLGLKNIFKKSPAIGKALGNNPTIANGLQNLTFIKDIQRGTEEEWSYRAFQEEPTVQQIRYNAQGEAWFFDETEC